MEIEETDDFLVPMRPPQYGEPASNISSEQAANLERQIEDEMRDLVSGLNMSAMSFDPDKSVDPFAGDRSLDDRRLSHQAHTDVIAFSGMHSFSEMSETTESDGLSERAAMSDDRDLLVIENDLESVRGGAEHTTATSRAVLHPYAKLFTKLRNS